MYIYRTENKPEPSNHALLDPKQAAKFLGLKPCTLAVWRSKGRYDLPFLRIGGRIRYLIEDLQDWIDKHYDGSKDQS